MFDLPSYRELLEITATVAMIGAGIGLLAALARFSFAEEAGSSLSPVLRVLSGFMLAACVISLGLNATAMAVRYVEVQHWPAQSMYEVIPMGTTACFLSMMLLYFVLGLHGARGIARGFGDLFMALILAGAWATLGVVLDLDPSGRALPPALQSAWFSTHISAYMFGYFTLFIATLGTWLHFCFKFWRGIFQASQHPLTPKTRWAIPGAALLSVPFGNMGLALGPGVFLLAACIAAISVRRPSKMAWFDDWEEGADRFTWLIFVVGFPFLTAGLIQGSLWAHEAWAFYWGWDSKEVSALISWIFYLVYLHLRYVRGWRGERGMWILFLGGLSIYITFQLFGDLPASQSSLHRYTDPEVVPAEGMMGTGMGN